MKNLSTRFTLVSRAKGESAIDKAIHHAMAFLQIT